MARRVYVSNIEASYFTTNSLVCGSGIPAKGFHKVGDLIISNIQRNEVIGWVCVTEGEPGEWVSIRNAGQWLDIEIQKINDDLSEIKIFNQQIDARVDLLQENVEKNSTAIENNKVSINDINIGLDNINNNLMDLNKDIDSLEKANEEARENINQQIVGITENINEINKEITNNKANITESLRLIGVLDDSFKEYAASGSETLNNITKELNSVKDAIGMDEEGNTKEGGLRKEIDDLKEALGLKEGEEGSTSIKDEIDDIKETIGEKAEGDKEATGIQKEIDDLKELIGAKVEEDEENTINIIEDIKDIQDMLEENSFFNENKLIKGDGIPTEGEYNEGDMIISNSQFDNIIGWICVKSGNPGEWEPITKSPEVNVKKNNQTYVSEMIGVARSYYKARYNADGEAIFNYDANNTALDFSYDGDGERANSIDCSTFIGLVLRGLSIENSPYAHLINNVELEDDADIDEGNDEGNHDENDEIGETGGWDPMLVTADIINYPWAIDLMNWSLPKIPTGLPQPIRTASQMAQWMCERGLAIPLDPLFNNVEPGDIIFWAKTVDGEYKQPNRYKHISHVAMCVGKYERNDTIPEMYPWKHTMLEVTTKSPFVLNRTLEKCRPKEVVLICRPDLGSISAGEYTGNVNTKEGIVNVADIMRPGVYYLTSKITEGLPEGKESGIYFTLKVDRTMTRLGKVYSLIQTLINAKDPREYYVRSQYCYSHAPNNVDWTDWVRMGDAAEINELKNDALKYWVGTQAEYEALEEKDPGRLYIITD